MGYTIDQLHPSKYLKGADVTPPVVATMSRVTIEKMTDNDNETEEKGILSFLGGRLKPMPLNWTNLTFLGKTFGNNSDAWQGKQVEIYFDPSIMAFGEVKGGIRLRLPTAFGVPPRQQRAPGLMTFEQAKMAISDAGITYEELVAHLKANGMTTWICATGTPLVQQLIAARVQVPAEQAFDPDGPPPDDNIPF